MREQNHSHASAHTQRTESLLNDRLPYAIFICVVSFVSLAVYSNFDDKFSCEICSKQPNSTEFKCVFKLTQ